MAIRPQEEQDAIRNAAFTWLDRQRLAGVDEFHRDKLSGFTYRGEIISLIDRVRGIRNPRDFTATLSVWTSHDHRRSGQYRDEIDLETARIRYSYQLKGEYDAASDRDGPNATLRQAFIDQVPLIYFVATRANYAVAHYPV